MDGCILFLLLSKLLISTNNLQMFRHKGLVESVWKDGRIRWLVYLLSTCMSIHQFLYVHIDTSQYGHVNITCILQDIYTCFLVLSIVINSLFSFIYFFVENDDL